MKKIVAGVAALLLVAYPAAAWWTGKQVEATVAEQYKTLEKLPLVKVVKREYQRGVFSSTEVATFEVLGELIRGIREERAGESADNASDAKAAEPLRFAVRSEISHGPFAGGQFAAASVDSELVLDDEARKELSKVFGDKKPLTTRTVFGFDGGGRSSMESPAFTHSFKAAEGEGATVTWGGIKADIDFTRDVESFGLQGTMPRLEIKDSKGVHMLVSDIKMSGNQKRLFKDEPLLYGGTQRFEVAQMEITSPASEASALGGEGVAAKTPAKPVLLKNLTYIVDAPANGGEYLDIAARLAAASIVIDQQDYGPAHYDISMKHLHARTVAKFYRAVLQMYADPAALKAEPGAALAAMGEPAMALLSHDPEFAVDRISFNSAHGEARLSARVKLKDSKPEDLAQPMSLLGKLDAVAELKLPAALAAEYFSGKAQSPEEKHAQQQAQQMFTAQVDALAAQGYLTNAQGVLESKITFQNGQLAINGKPFDPRAVMGGGKDFGADEPEAPTPAARAKKRKIRK